MNNRGYYKALVNSLKSGNITRKTYLTGSDIGHEEIWKSGKLIAENFKAKNENAEVLTEIVQAKPFVVMFGAGHVGKALYELCSFVGISTAVVDPRIEVNNEERFPKAKRFVMSYEEFFKKDEEFFNPYYCIFTHGHLFDRECLKYCVSKESSYIGMIGSKGKVAKTFASLIDEGVSKEKLDKVHSPIGLTIGGDSPEEIAVSIMAEIISVYAEHKHRATAEVSFLKELEKVDSGVLCRIVHKTGSGPREVGTEMLVLPNKTVGTVGGGALEKTVIKDAREVKENTVKHYGLSAADDLGMICGGNVDILFQIIKG